MPTIYDKVLYEGKTLSEVTNPSARHELQRLITKLQPIESDIIRYDDADITMTEDGNIFTIGFPSDLGGKISKIVTGAA